MEIATKIKKLEIKFEKKIIPAALTIKSKNIVFGKNKEFNVLRSFYIPRPTYLRYYYENAYTRKNRKEKSCI